MTTNNKTNNVVIGEDNNLTEGVTTNASTIVEDGLKIVEENAFEDQKDNYEGYFSEFFNILAEEEIVEDNFREIAALISLPDDSFDAISEQLLAEMEDTMTSPSTRIMMAEALRKDNISPDDAIEIFQNAIQNIEEEMDTLDQKRKDFFKRYFGIIINIIQGLEGLSDRIISIPVEYCREVKAPQYASEGDAGMDLYAPEEYTIEPGVTKIIPTGIKMAIPKGYAILIQPRSGQSVKTKLRIANTPGLIDSGYRDEIGVIIENIDLPIKDIEYDFDEDGKPIIKSILHGTTYTIHKDERFAQMRLVAVPTAALYEVESVGEIGKNRGGGFGHTGI